MGWRRWPICKRVLVNLDDGRAFRGILYHRRGPLLILRDAELIEPGAAPIAVDGEVIVERTRVSFIQVQP
jgi:small nuclear ribonucleoprotein (snRNP)-like protein